MQARVHLLYPTLCTPHGSTCDEGTQDSNIKTILFILRTIDTEEGRLGRTGVDPYILKPETGTSNHVTMSVSATSWLDRHNPRSRIGLCRRICWDYCTARDGILGHAGTPVSQSLPM
jgi:hypothetical protein